MDELTKKALHVRYIKLHFIIAFLEDTVLPPNKPSAIRGGIGEMLLRSNCIRDRNCEACDFREDCIVQRTMYSRFRHKPAFVTTGESVGYVLECENSQEYFKKGECLDFSLLLFGSNIVYFNQYLQAVCALGVQGLGRHKAHFQLTAVRNTEGMDILAGNQIYMERYTVDYLDVYVEKQLRKGRKFHRMVFYTPLTLKYQGEFRNEFYMEAILAGIRRRIYMLDCFEGIQQEAWMQRELPQMEIAGQRAAFRKVERYSARRDSKMKLYGLTGEIYLREVPREAEELLTAGELIHVGKNTSFGFGRYQLQSQRGAGEVR